MALHKIAAVEPRVHEAATILPDELVKGFCVGVAAMQRALGIQSKTLLVGFSFFQGSALSENSSAEAE